MTKFGALWNSYVALPIPFSNILQDIETSHLSQLRTHVETYCQIVDYNNNQLGRVYQDFQIQLTDLTVENLLEQFTLAKHTGLEKPGKLLQIKFNTILADRAYLACGFHFSIFSTS